MPVLAVAASEVRVRDRFADGAVVTAVREKPDGSLVIVTHKGRSRHGVVHPFHPDAPVTVLRLGGRRTAVPSEPSAHLTLV